MFEVKCAELFSNKKPKYCVCCCESHLQRYSLRWTLSVLHNLIMPRWSISPRLAPPSMSVYWHGFVRQLCCPPAGAQSQTGARIGLGHIGHRRAMLPSCRLRDPELAASPERHLGFRPGSLRGLGLRKTVEGVGMRAGLDGRMQMKEKCGGASTSWASWR